MTRLECIKSNAFLLGLNMNKATKEQKIQWLCQVIDNETDKPEDEIDFALIGECSAYLRELSDKAAEATKEQKQRILQQIKAHHNQIATTKSAKVLRPSWKTTRKVVAIAIAAVLLLTLTLSVIAKVKGYSSAWEYIRENAKVFFDMSPGNTVTDGEITLIKNDGVVAYKSIEELLESEGLDIMYPSELPDGVRIKKISQQIIDKETIVYCYIFSDQNLSITISTAHDILEEDLGKYESLKVEEIMFYIEKDPEGIYQAVGYYEEYEYRICCNDYIVLTKILNGMREIGQ